MKTCDATRPVMTLGRVSAMMMSMCTLALNGSQNGVHEAYLVGFLYFFLSVTVGQTNPPLRLL